MSQFNTVGRSPSLGQLATQPAAKPESKAEPSGRLVPGKGSMRIEEAPGVAGKALGLREASAVPAAGGLPPLSPSDGQSLNLLVMALANAARTDKLTPARIERVVGEALKKVVNPARQAKQQPPLALDADTSAHLVRRLGRNARQFFSEAGRHDTEYRNYRAVVSWASARLTVDRNLLDFGMLRTAVMEGLPPGDGPFGDLERVGLRSGVESLVAASGAGVRGREEVFEDARDVLAAGGKGVHPGWLETAMYTLNAADRRGKAPADAKSSGTARGPAHPQAAQATTGAAGEEAAIRRAAEAMATPLRRQEQLMRAIFDRDPQASPEQYFAAFCGLGRGAAAAGRIEEEDAGPMMRLLVNHALKRGIHSVDDLPAMIAGLAEGLRSGFAGKGQAFLAKLNPQLVEAVLTAGGARLGPFGRELAQVSLGPGFPVEMGYRDALRSPLGPRSDTK